ncbi:hypothetical protein KKH23_08045 [Patescibacteria group bacterium]|nr:hypothetical protein [Patescibacteria group bacterium]
MDGMIEPLTAEEQTELVSHAKYLIGIYPPTESETITLRWAATLEALRRRAEGAERNRDMYRGFLERQRARVAELVAERDAWREEHDMWRDGFMATKARADMWRDGWDAEGGDDE